VSQSEIVALAKEEHPYEVPGISTRTITGGNPDYLTWIAQDLRDPDGFRQLLRPACRRCTARRGITGPIASRLPPHLTVCRRHRLWTGPAARTHAGQLDISPFPEILRAQRRHLAELDDHPRQDV